MFNKIADNRNPDSLSAKYRKKRFLLFENLIAQLEKPIRILDVGGTQRFWEVMGLSELDGVYITLINIDNQTVSSPNFKSVVGNACDMRVFTDGWFDVVFSNSVIEHVGGNEDQIQMAEEVKRVGNRYFIQTPNKYFPIEPHFLFPFFQFLPIPFRIWLLCHFDLGWVKKVKNFEEANNTITSIRLLKKGEFIHLFPEASLYEEKIMGITKSFIVYYGWD